MSRSTIHGILSGAFEAAQRREWVDFNPAESAKAHRDPEEEARTSPAVVKGGRKVPKGTKAHQDRYNAVDPVTCALIEEHLALALARLAGTGVRLAPDAHLFFNRPAGIRP